MFSGAETKGKILFFVFIRYKQRPQEVRYTINMCQTRMTIIQPPITYIYSIFFIIGGIMALFANLIVLRILWIPDYRSSRSNKILTSLALSDFLVGLVVFPLTAVQILSHESLNNCNIDFTRVYFSLLLEGSSCLSLAVISYDRYILMTKMRIYHKRYVRRAMVIFIFLAWFIPGITPFLRYVGSLPYLAVTLTIYIIPYIVLCTSYILITNAVKKQELLLKNHYLKSMNMQVGIVNEAVTQDLETANSAEVAVNKTENKRRKCQTTPTHHQKMKEEKSHIKLAKQVTILLLTYFFCVTPLLLWLILEFANILKPFISPYANQNLYLFAMLTISWNSCINPIVYYTKNPEIRRGFRKLFKIRQNIEESSNTYSKTQ